MKKATSIAESSSDLILKVIKKHQKNIFRIRMRLDKSIDISVILTDLYYIITRLEKQKSENNGSDGVSLKICQWLLTVCWSCVARSWECLAEGYRMSFRGDASWIMTGFAGFGGEKQLLGFANGWSKGKAYYEAHQTFRCALEEIVSIIKRIVKDPKTNAQISDKYKKRLSLLEEEVTFLTKEADVLLRGMEPIISS